ncbi:MAG: tripartite tricarboxylate transporter permease [Negativicutes bacterium]|nr:tripartite tricarboxylate transporter permease [Negativicutes bacterium]
METDFNVDCQRQRAWLPDWFDTRFERGHTGDTFIFFGKKLAKDPSRFGKGAIEGVAGPETANNAYCGAALIPLFTLGIPSSPTIAVLFGAFIMHGLTPGPALFQNNANFVWAVIASMFIGNFILLIMNLPMVPSSLLGTAGRK